jgi:putative flippase GtrA
MNRHALLHWLTAPVECTLLQVPRALAASGLAAALDCGLLVVLVEMLNWPALAAAVVSYTLGAVLQYVLCSAWVFPAAPQNLSTGLAAFAVLSLVGLGITGVTLTALHDVAHVNYLVAKGMALGLAFAWNFLSRKLLLFRPGAVAVALGK